MPASFVPCAVCGGASIATHRSRGRALCCGCYDEPDSCRLVPECLPLPAPARKAAEPELAPLSIAEFHRQAAAAYDRHVGNNPALGVALTKQFRYGRAR